MRKYMGKYNEGNIIYDDEYGDSGYNKYINKALQCGDIT